MVEIRSIEKMYTIAEYLHYEDASTVRHEFHNGTLLEMAGGTLPHNVVKGEFYTLVNLAIRSAGIPHMVLNSDTKVRIESKNRFVYPDLTITDGQPVYYHTPLGTVRRDIIINPLVIVEVLSDDTRALDRSEKFDLYSAIPGFREYVLIEPETAWVKTYFLQDPANDLWHIQTLTDLSATLTLQALPLTIRLDDLYRALDKLPKE